MAQAKNAKKRGKQFSKAYQPPAERKRVKKNKTIIKEKIGLQSWEALGEFVLTNGADKLKKEMSKLKGSAYSKAYIAIAEYFKPKLQRTDVKLTAPKGSMVVMTQDEITKNEVEKLK